MDMMTATKQLSTILGIGSFPKEFDVAVYGISSDSRTVQQGDLFIAYQGVAVDGRQYIDQAIKKGAIAVVLEQENGQKSAPIKQQWSELKDYPHVPLVSVQNLREQLGELAANFFDRSAEKMTLVGITGTNGKTSCSQYIAQLLNQMQHTAAVIGTLGWGVGDSLRDTNHTTPDAIQLQRILRDLQQHGSDYVAMEVSSHGLEQKRVTALNFEAALFTNLSHDHLDYHDTMAAYGAAKQKLFETPGLKYALINGDDPFGRKLVKQLPESVQAYTFSTRVQDADICVSSVSYSLDGVDASINTPWGEAELHSALLGEFNLSNLLGVIGVLCALGFDLESVIENIATLAPVPGRMEGIANSAGLNVVVDYAHTPDALSNVLRAVRQHCSAKLWCVFGCGGDRDPMKRPLMGEIAAQLADYVVVTNDNPRSENGEQIAEQIVSGCCSRQQLVVELDRAKAIQYALQHAEPGDSVLIAGKGHEEYQEINGERFSFSDRVVAQQVLLEITNNQGGLH